MKANQLATLVLRLIGIYVLLDFIPAISILISTVPLFVNSQMDWNASQFIAICVPSLIFFCQLILGILLIVKSGPWGEKLAPSNSEEINTAISSEQIQVLVFAAFGILIFASALPQLLNSVYLFFNSAYALTHKDPNSNYYSASPSYYWHNLLVAIGTFLKVAMGLWMFFGAHGFTNFWRSMRSFATPKAPAIET